jgi:hypothetical protein
MRVGTIVPPCCSSVANSRLESRDSLIGTIDVPRRPLVSLRTNHAAADRVDTIPDSGWWKLLEPGDFHTVLEHLSSQT